MSLAGVAGNHELIAGLEAELARRPAHAYLFAGPRGVGKSIVARGVAHNILCERSPGAAILLQRRRLSGRVRHRRARPPDAPPPSRPRRDAIVARLACKSRWGCIRITFTSRASPIAAIC